MAAYRRYLIRHNALNGLWWIERGGQFISYATDESDARRIVDALAQGDNPPRGRPRAVVRSYKLPDIVENLSRPGARAPHEGDVVRVASGRTGTVTYHEGRASGVWYSVSLDPQWSRAARKAISAKVAQLVEEGYPPQQAVRVAHEEARAGTLAGNPMKFLVNPPKRGGRAMARRRKLSHKQKLAGFGGKAAKTRAGGGGTRKRKRRNPSTRRSRSRSTTTRRRTTTAKRRRTYRRNPPARDFVGLLMDGTVEAAEILVGKAGVRIVPALLNLPRTGNTGLAVQAGVALLDGYLAHMVFGPRVGAAILAGGLTAPLEDLAVKLNLPYVSAALAQPAGSAGTTSGLAMYAAKMPPRRALPPARGKVGNWVTQPPGSGIDAVGAMGEYAHIYDA